MKDKELETMFGVTAEQLEESAALFERGEWPEGRTVILGRPRLADESLKTVTFKMPIRQVAALDNLAAERGINRSDYLRGMVEKEITGAQTTSLEGDGCLG
jgi:hypothetical protein